MHHIADDGQVIRIRGVGFYAEDAVRRHFERLEAIIARRRLLGRRVVALVDLRGAATQSATTAAIITSETNRLYDDPGDRVAIAVASVLLKLQLERAHKQQGFGVFLSLAEAEAFLSVASADA